MNKILNSVNRLKNYIESEKYFGYDPYDALTSPLFKLPFFRSNKTLRFAAQQAVKRSSVNIRPVLFISKGYNPVTLGLCIQAYVNLSKTDPAGEWKKKCDELLSELVRLIPSGFHGTCWGYDFDWEARHARIRAWQPTVVATGIISNALYSLYEATRNSEAGRLCSSACHFVLEDLRRTNDKDGFCFSYSPFDHQCVFNASMKAVRILAQGFKMGGETRLAETAKDAANWVVQKQERNGAWKYSVASSGTRIDNYHTGYVLDCLHAYGTCTGDMQFSDSLERGWRFFREHFFDGSKPKFLHDSTYPVDTTAAAQSILTLCRFGDTESAKKTAHWMIDNMQDANGSFYFRRYKLRTSKISFMRWSNAWMFAALATLLAKLNKTS